MRAVVAVLVALVASLPAAQSPAWREAVLGLRTDASGAVWNFQENGELGRVGASALNRGQMLLIDGEAFAAQSAFMTEDGFEFLVSGQAGGVQASLTVVRRIRLDPGTGVVRYVELLRNEGGASRSLQVEVRTNLNGYYQCFVSDRGREMPVALQEGETGFWLAPESGKEGGRGYAFVLVGPGAEVKPVLGSNQSYVVSAHFKLEIAPGETAALLHGVRQAPLDSAQDPARLEEVFAAMQLDALQAQLPRAIRENLRNLRAEGRDKETPFWMEPPGMRQAGDLLAMTDGGELRGHLRPGCVTLETVRGSIQLDAADLVAAAVGAAGGRIVNCWLRGGEVVRGKVAEDQLRFALNSGPEIPLRWEGLKHLRRDREQETDLLAPAWVRSAAEEQLRLGEGWRVAPGRWETAYGPLELKLGEVRRLEAADGGPRLTLRDGSRVAVRSAGSGAVPLGGRFEGRELALAEIRGLWQPAGGAGEAEAGPDVTGFVETLGGDLLGWQDQGETLGLETEQGRLDLPMTEVRRMEREGGGFRVALWDGSLFSGRPVGGGTLALRGVCDWRIPWADLKALTAGPAGAAGKRGAEIEAAVQGLRADAWATRKQAEEALRGLGELAVPRLRELRETGDADLRHRAGLLLEELEPDHAGAR